MNTFIHNYFVWSS